jgi:hypothetical protein
MFVCMHVLKIFLGYVRKNRPPPPARQQFWGKILMLSLPVRANYTVPPPKQDDAHTPMQSRHKSQAGNFPPRTNLLIFSSLYHLIGRNLFYRVWENYFPFPIGFAKRDFSQVNPFGKFNKKGGRVIREGSWNQDGLQSSNSFPTFKEHLWSS